jgi:hypothetical protein
LCPPAELISVAQEAFRPDTAGTQLIAEMPTLTEHDRVVDNQKLSGLAGNDLPGWLSVGSTPCS